MYKRQSQYLICLFVHLNICPLRDKMKDENNSEWTCITMIRVKVNK